MPADVETMFYAGEVPWHRTGKAVEGLQHSKDAIQYAGLNWEVEKVPQYFDWNGEKRQASGSNAILRTSDGVQLSKVGVGDRYEPIQNSEAFEFFDAVVGEGQAIYETAGSLDSGRKVWLLANMNKSFEVIKGDEIKQYLALFNSHDGSSTMGVMLTPTRIVCSNTLNIAMRNASVMFKIRHTTNYRAKIEEAKRVLGFAEHYYGLFEEEMRGFHGRVANLDITKVFIDRLIPMPETKQEGRIRNWEEKQNLFKNLITQGRGTEVDGVRGSFYGLFNAATEFADHHLGMKGKSLSAEDKTLKRADSLLFGRAASFKQKAYNLLSRDLVNA